MSTMSSKIEDVDAMDMIYDYKTRPQWHMCILLGLQHFITMCVPNAMTTIILINQLCLEKDSPVKSELISISFFIMGITTMTQTLVGTRLPIIQGSTFALLLPSISLANSPEIANCNLTNNVFIKDRFVNQTMPESVYHVKMRLICGAFMITSLIEILLGASGLLKFLVRLISPLSLAAIYTVLSMSIVSELIYMMAGHWAISLTGTCLMVVITLALAPIAFPFPSWTRKEGCSLKRLRIFQSSPILISISIVWGLCAILTISGAFPNSPDKYGYQARTDIKLRAVYEAPVFKVPYPMRWGVSLIMPSAIIGMSAGIIISIVESIGDYMITAEVCKAPPIPDYAICRGIFVEGIGVFLSGLLGSAVAPTSYSDNIGVLRITRAGHRSIAQVAAVIMLLCGVSPIIGAVFVSIPDPAIGGIIMVITMMILGVGLTYLQYVNLKSMRNGLIFALSVAFGLFIPIWCRKNFAMISTGVRFLDDTIRTVLSIGIFIATVLSVFLDNILPGTYKIPNQVEIPIESKETEAENRLVQMQAYDAFVLKWMAEKWTFLQNLPMMPSYLKVQSKIVAQNNIQLSDV